jgi:hypothetical protein
MFRLLLSHHQALKIQIQVTMFIYCTVGSPIPMLIGYINKDTVVFRLIHFNTLFVLLNTSGWNTLSSIDSCAK